MLFCFPLCIYIEFFVYINELYTYWVRIMSVIINLHCSNLPCPLSASKAISAAILLPFWKAHTATISILHNSNCFSTQLPISHMPYLHHHLLPRQSPMPLVPRPICSSHSKILIFKFKLQFKFWVVIGCISTDRN